MSDEPPFRSRGARASAAFLAALALTAPSPAAAREADPPVVERIGDVSVLTPPCGDLPCRGIYGAARIQGWLEGFVGGPFDPSRVTRSVERHYTYLGYRPRVEASLHEGALELRVTEAPAVIAEIAADPGLLAPYLPAGTIAEMDPIPRGYVPMRAVRARPGDLVNRDRMIEDEYDVSLLGYDMVRVPAPGTAEDAPRRYAVVRRLPKRIRRKVEAADPSAGGTVGGEEAAAGPARIEPLALTVWDGTADYSRRQLFTARLTYQRANVFREFDRVEVSPYVARRLAGSLSYSIPYLLPELITPWNLFAGIKLYDEFTPDRQFIFSSGSGSTATTRLFSADQENEGARFAVGLAPLTHADGQSLSGSLYVNRYRVSFSGCTISVNCERFAGSDPRIPGSSQNDVNILGVSFDYGYEHLFRPPRFSWRFIPTAEVATKAWGGDLAFRRVSGELKQHYAFSTGFEIDTSWKAGVVDRRVPVFEEFALGGPDSLRGFLRDDFIGRRFLSAQNDLWIPIPFRAMDRDSELMAALQRNLKVAILADAGSVSFDELQRIHFARGLGVGLRYSAEKSPLLVSIDAAWGSWQGVRRFYPYVSVTRKW